MIDTLKKLYQRINRVYYKITNREPWYKYYGNNNKIDYPDLTIYELIEKTANTYPAYYAYEYYGKKVTYKDWLGNERTEEFNFNLTKAALMEMQFEKEGGMREYLQRIIDAKDRKELMTMFKDLVLRAYGEISPDGKYFIQNEETKARFASTPVYSMLFMELTDNADVAAEFVNGIMPPDLDKVSAKPGQAPIAVAPPTN